MRSVCLAVTILRHVWPCITVFENREATKIHDIKCVLSSEGHPTFLYRCTWLQGSKKLISIIIHTTPNFEV